MPDWTAPFTIPKYTKEEFRAMKAAYVAKHGYTITFPGLYDIIKLPIEVPMTEQETKDWKARRYDKFSEIRLYEIRRMKKKRKDKFLAMLASPAPEVITNVGSFMTAIDDAQDCLFTIGGLGIAAMRFTPPSVAAILALPTGATLTAASALNVIQTIGKQGMPGITAKRAWQKKTGIDPWSKKGRIAYAKQLIKTFPKKAFGIQALQTTNEVFGVGLSLGAIVGLFVDVVAGPVRRIYGDKVNVKLPIPTYDEFCKAAQYYGRKTAAYFYPGVQTSNEEVLTMMTAHWLSQVALFSGTRDRPGWENFENLDDIELQMPLPKNPLTLEVMAEEGINPEDVCNWPHSGKRWAPATEIAEEYEKPCQDYCEEYMGMHDKDWIGYIFKTLAGDAHFYTMAAAEGEDQIRYDYTATSKACSILLENRMYPDPGQPKEKVKLLADKIELWEAMDIKPTLRNLTEFCENRNIVLISY